MTTPPGIVSAPCMQLAAIIITHSPYTTNLVTIATMWKTLDKANTSPVAVPEMKLCLLPGRDFGQFVNLEDFGDVV